MFTKTSDVHNYSTRQADMPYVQYASTKRVQRTIKHIEAKLWNSLYNSIPTDCAINAYKQKLKAFLQAWHSPYLFHAIVIVIIIIIIIIHIIIIIIITIVIFRIVIHLALCSCSPYIIYTCRCLRERVTHKSSLQPPLSKLWFHCTSRQLLSFKLNYAHVCLADFLCTILAINVFSLSFIVIVIDYSPAL